MLLPKLDGRTALRRIRDLEAARGLAPGKGAKVIMATGQDDAETVMASFRDFCDGFLAKPLDRARLLGLLQRLELLGPTLPPPARRRAAVPWRVTRKRLGLVPPLHLTADEPLFGLA